MFSFHVVLVIACLLLVFMQLERITEKTITVVVQPVEQNVMQMLMMLKKVGEVNERKNTTYVRYLSVLRTIPLHIK